MLIIKGFLKKVSEPTCRKCHHYLQQFLVMVILHLAIVIENHRCSLFLRYKGSHSGNPSALGLPVRAKFNHALLIFSPKACASAPPPGHGSVAHYIVEGKGNVHAVRAAKHAVKYGRFPREHVHIDRSTLLRSFQFSLLHSTGDGNTKSTSTKSLG